MLFPSSSPFRWHPWCFPRWVTGVRAGGGEGSARPAKGGWQPRSLSCLQHWTTPSCSLPSFGEMSSVFSQEMTIFHLPKESSLARPYNSIYLPSLIALIGPYLHPSSSEHVPRWSHLSCCFPYHPAAAAPPALCHFPPFASKFPFCPTQTNKKKKSHKPNGSSLCRIWASQIPFSAEKMPSADFFLDWEICSPAVGVLQGFAFPPPASQRCNAGV